MNEQEPICTGENSNRWISQIGMSEKGTVTRMYRQEDESGRLCHTSGVTECQTKDFQFHSIMDHCLLLIRKRKKLKPM